MSSKRFLYINFESCNFTEFTDALQQFSDSILKVFYIYYHVICNSNRFTSSFPICISFILFSSLMIMTRASKIMLNKSGESGHPCLVPHLRGNAFSFSPLSMMLAVGLAYMTFIVLRYVPSGAPKWLSSKEHACQCRRRGFSRWVRKIPWRRKWQPTPVFLPGKSRGQRSLEGYSPWGCKRVRHDLVTKTTMIFPLCPLSREFLS